MFKIVENTLKQQVLNGCFNVFFLLATGPYKRKNHPNCFQSVKFLYF